VSDAHLLITIGTATLVLTIDHGLFLCLISDLVSLSIDIEPVAPPDSRIPLCLLLRVTKAHSHHRFIVVQYLTLDHLATGDILIIKY
jgi:hypothetical protein